MADAAGPVGWTTSSRAGPRPAGYFSTCDRERVGVPARTARGCARPPRGRQAERPAFRRRGSLRRSTRRRPAQRGQQGRGRSAGSGKPSSSRRSRSRTAMRTRMRPRVLIGAPSSRYLRRIWPGAARPEPARFRAFPGRFERSVRSPEIVVSPVRVRISPYAGPWARSPVFTGTSSSGPPVDGERHPWMRSPRRSMSRYLATRLARVSGRLASLIRQTIE